MKIKDLQIELQRQKVRNDAYMLDGGLPSETYCLNKVNNECWEIFYSERGKKSGLQTYSSEDEACQAFLSLILRDNSTRNVG